MTIKNIFDNGVNITTNVMQPGVSYMMDAIYEAVILLYTFVTRHQVLAVINIAVISINLFFIWTFGKRKSLKLHSQASPNSDKSSTYNKFLKKLQAEAQKNNASKFISSEKKCLCRRSNQREPQHQKPAPKAPKSSPGSGNLIKPSSGRGGPSSCCSSTLESSSDDQEETLDEITWGFDTSPLSSQHVTEMDSAGNCIKDYSSGGARGAPDKTVYRPQAPPLLLTKKFQPKICTYRRSRVNCDRRRGRRLVADPKTALDGGDRKEVHEHFKFQTNSPSPKKTSQLQKVAQSKSGDSESSPAKLFSNRSAFRRYVAPSRRGGKSSPLKTVMKTNKSWQHEASSDSEPERNQPNGVTGKQHSESSDQAGNRSETSIVCKRDSWIWFSPETKASDDDFISRQQKFKSEDPRVAELAEEIKRQDEMNKNIEREAESLIESSSQSYKYHVSHWAKTASMTQANRMRGRGRVGRCSPYARPSVGKPSSKRPRRADQKHTPNAGLKKTTKHSTPILLSDSPQEPVSTLREISPKGSRSDSTTLVFSERDRKPRGDAKCNDSTTASSSPVYVQPPQINSFTSGPHNKRSHVAGGKDIFSNSRVQGPVNNCPLLPKCETYANKGNVKKTGNNEASGFKKSMNMNPYMGDASEQALVISSSPLEANDGTITSSHSNGLFSSPGINITADIDSPEKRHSSSSLAQTFGRQKLSPRFYRDANDFKPLPTGKRSHQVVLSTGESESDSILKDKSCQEASFRQVLIRKEVNTAVHQLLFDTEQSSSSMSPSTMNKVSASMRLQQMLAKDKSPSIVSTVKSENKSSVFVQTSSSAVRLTNQKLPASSSAARLTNQKLPTKRTNIYNPDYYLGKKVKAKNRQACQNSKEYPIFSSPSRWKKTDTFWTNTISPRLYSPRTVVSPSMRLNVDKEIGFTGRLQCHTSYMSKSILKIASSKEDRHFTVYSNKLRPQACLATKQWETGCSIFKKHMSSCSLTHPLDISKSTSQEHKNGAQPNCAVKKSSSIASTKICKAVIEDIKKKKTNVLKRKPTKVESIRRCGEGTHPSRRQMSSDSDNSRPDCKEGKLQFSSVKSAQLKSSDEEAKKIVTYSDSYWAKNVRHTTGRRSGSNMSLCFSRSPSIFSRSGSAEPSAIINIGEKETSVQNQKTHNVSTVLPGSTNNSSSSDPYLHVAGSLVSPKPQLCDTSAQFCFVGENKDKVNPERREDDRLQPIPQNDTVVMNVNKQHKCGPNLSKQISETAEIATSMRGRTNTSDGVVNYNFANPNSKHTFYLDSGTESRNGYNITPEQITDSLKLGEVITEEKTIQSGWRAQTDDATENNKKKTVLGENVISSHELFPCVAREKVRIREGTKGSRIKRPGCGIAHPVSFPSVDFEHNGNGCAVSHAGSNPDSGYEESFSDKSHFLEAQIPQFFRCSELGAHEPVNSELLSSCRVNELLKVAVSLSTSSCSQNSHNSENLAGVSPVRNIDWSDKEFPYCGCGSLFGMRSTRSRNITALKDSEDFIKQYEPMRNHSSKSQSTPRLQLTSNIPSPNNECKVSKSHFYSDPFQTFSPNECRRSDQCVSRDTCDQCVSRDTSDQCVSRDTCDQNETVHTTSYHQTDRNCRQSTFNEPKRTEDSDQPRKDAMKTASITSKTKKYITDFILDCSLSSCMENINYSPSASSSITHLIPNTNTFHSLSSPTKLDRLQDISLSTTNDIQLLESLCSVAPPAGSPLPEHDSTFDRSFTSDLNSEFMFSDSFAQKINAAVGEEVPTDAKNNGLHSNNCSSLVKTSYVKRQQEIIDKDPLEQFHEKHSELRSSCNISEVVKTHATGKKNCSHDDTNSKNDRIPIRSVAFAELLRRF